MPKVRSKSEAIAAVYDERTHGGCGDDALILLRER
jgi:hypothetical protein